MKTRVVILAVGLVALCGCVRHYVMTLNNGSRIDTNGKPKLHGGAYVYKDALGREMSVPVGRVREIAPASMSQQDKGGFTPGSSKP